MTDDEYTMPATPTKILKLEIEVHNWSAEVAEEFLEYAVASNYVMLLQGAPATPGGPKNIFLRVKKARVKS